MGGPGLCDGGGKIGPGQGLAEPQPQLGEQQRPVGVGEDGQAVLERLAGRVLLAAVLGDHAARERGARGQHGQFAVGRNLVQPHHARLGGLGVGEGELGLGEHDEQPRRPGTWSSPPVCQRLPGQANDVAVLAAGQVQRYQRQRGVHVTAAVVDQPFGVGQPPCRRFRSSASAARALPSMRGPLRAPPASGQAQRDLGVLPAPDIAQDLAHRRAAVRVDVHRPVLDAEPQLVLGDPGHSLRGRGRRRRPHAVSRLHTTSPDTNGLSASPEAHRHGLVQPGHPVPDRGQQETSAVPRSDSALASRLRSPSRRASPSDRSAFARRAVTSSMSQPGRGKATRTC